MYEEETDMFAFDPYEPFNDLESERWTPVVAAWEEAI